MINYKKVTPDGYNERAVLQMFREGILYYDATNEISGDERIKMIREYVARIDPLVTPKFRNKIDKLWNDIFQSEILSALFSKRGKCRKFTDFNKYNVVRVIGIMRSKGIYEDYPDPKFDALLEGTHKDSNYRRYLSQGLEGKEHKELDAIIKQNIV